MDDPSLKTAEDYARRGLELFEARRREESIPYFDVALRLDPDYHDAHFDRAVALHDLGDLAGAIAGYSEAIRTDPSYPTSYEYRGDARADLGDLAGAIADYSEVIRLEPLDAVAYWMRGVFYRRSGDMESALADFSLAIEIEPGVGGFHYDRAVVMNQLGDFEEAVEDLRNGAEQDPLNPWMPGLLGEIRFVQGLIEAAFECFEQALRMNADLIVPEIEAELDFRAGRALCLHRLGWVEDAQAAWREIINADDSYLDPDGVGADRNWRPELIDEARRLIAGLT